MSNWQKFVAVFDNHGSQIHKPSEEKFFKFVDLWKPDIKIHGGDNWDFAPLRKKADKHEREQSMIQDYKAGYSFLKRYQPHYFLRGNHDERLWELAEHGTGIEADYASSGVVEVAQLMKEMKCKILPYHKRDGIVRLGHLKIIHGFACGVFAARQTALVYGSTLFGHIHTIDEHSIPGLERRVARACGCLCLLDMPYNSRQPNSLRQAHGWAFGLINKTSGKYHVFQAEQVDNQWIIPSDIVEL